MLQLSHTSRDAMKPEALRPLPPWYMIVQCPLGAYGGRLCSLLLVTVEDLINALTVAHKNVTRSNGVPPKRLALSMQNFRAQALRA
jgi:hypothetical protein